MSNRKGPLPGRPSYTLKLSLVFLTMLPWYLKKKKEERRKSERRRKGEGERCKTSSEN